MALSGSLQTTIHSHWTLRIEWSASQNISDNTSTVTAKLYWIADSYGAINSSQTKSGTVVIDGSTYSFSASAALKNGQKKLITTKSKTIKHNSDGTKSFSIYGTFEVKLDISGYVNEVKIPSKSFTLNTIPRESTLTSGTDLTAGTDRTISISRASSSFSHRVYVDVKDSSGDWYNIKAVDFSTSQTSKSTSFSVSENKDIFSTLNQRASTDLRWNLRTYDGNTIIGTTGYSGKLSRPKLSTTKSVNGEAGDSNSVYVDQKISIDITRSNSDFDHKVQFYCGSFMKEFNGVTTSLDWTPSSSEQDSLYKELGTASSKGGYIRVYTYYNGVRIGYDDTNITFYARSSVNKPVFKVDGVVYSDSNPTTLEITGNDQYIIQGKSTLKVEIPVESKAIAQNGATMKSYSITVNGDTKTINYSDNSTVSADFSSINSDSNATVTIKAIDSRGFSTAVTKIITVIPYHAPSATTSALRANGFEASTTLSLRGSLSSLAINGVNKNVLKTARYRYKKAEDSDYGSWVDFTISGFPSYAATSVLLDLDALLTWNVQVEVSDALSVTTKNLTVAVGKPILFLDAEKKSVGIGDFPTGEYELAVNGRVVFGANQYASQGQGEGTAGGALFMNNSDITGANGIYFNDVSDNNGEGLLFPKTGTPEASPDRSNYDTIYVRDAVLYLNGGKGNLGIGNTLDLKSNSITNVKNVTIAGPNAGSGIDFAGGNGWRIAEGKNDADSNITYGAGQLQFVQNGLRRAVISTGGGFYIGGTTFKGESGGMTHYASTGEARLVSDLGGVVVVGRDGDGPRVNSTTIYERTYPYSSNMYVTSNGNIGRSTSASKYKINISRMDTDKIAERLLKVHPKSWFDKQSIEAYSRLKTKAYFEDKHEDELGEFVEVDLGKQGYGLIAEDLIDVGLDMFVEYGKPDENGNREAEGVQYDRIWILLIPLLNQAKAEIEHLQEEVAQLKSKIKEDEPIAT
ncbi:hypothetical protein Goe25_00870 [Bacillus phage vB_BsuM-Goe25]|nr:hypothetical protein Goe25_00870 [Bacillus phage vB_BsuM-Goe25]